MRREARGGLCMHWWGSLESLFWACICSIQCITTSTDKHTSMRRTTTLLQLQAQVLVEMQLQVLMKMQVLVLAKIQVQVLAKMQVQRRRWQRQQRNAPLRHDQVAHRTALPRPCRCQRTCQPRQRRQLRQVPLRAQGRPQQAPAA